MNQQADVGSESTVRCGYCFGDLKTNQAPECPTCGAAHHRDCWLENDGCVQFGCPSGGPEQRGSLYPGGEATS